MEAETSHPEAEAEAEADMPSLARLPFLSAHTPSQSESAAVEQRFPSEEPEVADYSPEEQEVTDSQQVPAEAEAGRRQSAAAVRLPAEQAEQHAAAAAEADTTLPQPAEIAEVVLAEEHPETQPLRARPAAEAEVKTSHKAKAEAAEADMQSAAPSTRMAQAAAERQTPVRHRAAAEVHHPARARPAARVQEEGMAATVEASESAARAPDRMQAHMAQAERRALVELQVRQVRTARSSSRTSPAR